MQAQERSSVQGATANRALNEAGPAGSLRTAGTYPFDYRAYTAAALADGKLLLYGVYPVQVDAKDPVATLQKRTDAARYGGVQAEALMWSPQHRGWKKVERPSECAHNRYLHTMTPLPNGKVLIAGGLCDGPRMANDDTPYAAYTKLSLWNGTTLKWEAAPELSVSRISHTASLLKDGSVLFVGGENDPGFSKPDDRVLARVESYRDGVMTELAPLHKGRAKHTASALADGSALVIGGIDADGKPMNSVEVWDPQKQTWRDGPALKTARYRHSATVLTDGTLMVAGGIGHDGHPIGSVEIWNPTTAAWSDGVRLLYPLQGHSAALLANGDVLVMGGFTLKGTPAARATSWNKSTAQWQPAGAVAVEQDDKIFSAVTLVARQDGSAHVLGFRRILQWKSTKIASSPYAIYGERNHYASTLLNEGRVLLTGGVMTSLLSDLSGWPMLDAAEIYHPPSGSFTVTGRMNQTRILHSTIALDDGSVVVAGGWVWGRDRYNEPTANSPEVWDSKTGAWSMLKDIRFEAHDWVHMGKLQDGRILFLASGESIEPKASGQTEYRAWLWTPQTGNVERKQVSAKPRSGAAIAILADGRVLRVGGYLRSFDAGRRCPPQRRGADKAAAEQANDCQDEAPHWVDRPDPSAELWDSRTGKVSTLEAPPNWNVRDGKSLLLKNGNVLFIEHRPAHIIHNRVPPQANMLLWNGRTEKWQPFPTLATHLNWPMLELNDGSLRTQTSHLPPGAPAWLAAPPLLQGEANLTLLASGELLALSSTQPHAALFDEKARRWQVQSPNDVAPAWHSKPAAVMLADGRVMVIAKVETTQAALPTAHIWNPKDNRWSDAGRLAHDAGEDTQAILLPSGRVMHVGIGETMRLNCEIWQVTDNAWEDCSSLIIAGKFSSPPGLGLLDDGRVALVAGPTAVFVFDEKNKQWVSMKAEWNSAQLTYGAPIRVDQPLQRIYDEERKEWLDSSGVAGRYWEKITPRRKYAVEFSDRPTQEYEGRGRPPYLLWDPKKKHWAYVFIHEKMGRHAQFLPDGCAFSWTGFSIFNPTTGQVTQLTDPGTGIQPGHGSMVVLPDSTVVIAGLPDRGAGPGPGTGFFQRKVFCAGFAAQPGDDALMPAVLYTEERPVATPSLVAAPAAWWVRLADSLNDYRWIILAVLGPILFYVLMRTVILPPLRTATQRVASHAMSNESVERLKQPLSKPYAFGVRVVVYGLALVVVLPMLWSYIQFKRATNAEACAEDAAACIDKKTGILQSIPALEKTNSLASAKPAIPCRFVGVWSSRQQRGLMYRITLKDDGTYTMAPNEFMGGTGQTGFWAVQGDKMVWRHKTGINTGEPDINPILSESDTRFTLVEENGSHTKFELIQAVKSSTCTR